MSKELYIGGKIIELSDLSRIGTTYQVHILSDLESRQGTYTNDFFAPLTKNNNAALENSGNINSYTNLPYKKNSVRYIEDGIEMITDGFAIVKSFASGYNITVYSGNVTPFDLMSNKKLKDLNLSAYDHQYTASNVIASYTNTDGYIYPNIDFRKPGSALTNSNAGRVPFTFVKTILEKITSEIRYAITGNFKNDFYYKNTILSTVFKHDESWRDDKVVNSTYAADDAETDIYGSTTPITAVYPLNFPNQGYFVGQVYFVPESGYYKFSATIPIDFQSAFFSNFAIQILNQTTSTMLDTDNVNLASLSGTTRSYTFNLDTGYISLTAGDQIQIRAQGVLPGIGTYHWKYLAGSQFKVEAKNTYIPYNGSDIFYSSIQPDLTQKDFFKAIMNMYGIVPQTNVYTREISLNKLNDIYTNTHKAVDWSEILDPKRGVEIVYRDENFAKRNWFRYSNDQDVKDAIADYHVYETDGYFEISDETLESETDMLKLPFSGTAGKIPYKNDDWSIDEFTPRVLVLPLRDTILSSTVTFSDVAFERGISFNKYSDNDSLIDNYSGVKKMMDRYKKITAYFRLTAAEISTMDFLIPSKISINSKYINIDDYFYVNVISNYKAGEPTKCELIRL